MVGIIGNQWDATKTNSGKWALDCHFLSRYIPSEKIGQNFDPLRKSFFVTNYLHWTGTSVLQPFLGPPDPWGGLGRHGGVLGGLPPPKMPLCLRDQFKPWNGLFWLMITGYTIFLRFRVKMGLSGPKKRPFWAQIGYAKKWIFLKNIIFKLVKIAWKVVFWVSPPHPQYTFVTSWI